MQHSFFDTHTAGLSMRASERGRNKTSYERKKERKIDFASNFLLTFSSFLSFVVPLSGERESGKRKREEERDQKERRGKREEEREKEKERKTTGRERKKRKEGGRQTDRVGSFFRRRVKAGEKRKKIAVVCRSYEGIQSC